MFSTYRYRWAGSASASAYRLIQDCVPESRRTLPSVAEGFHLKTWRGGPDAGKPKLSPTAKGLIARGLMRLDTGGPFPRLFFTEAGLTALRAMMTDRRLVDPKKFAHVRQELGIDPGSEDDAA
jgi:hypothetical protein